MGVHLPPALLGAFPRALHMQRHPKQRRPQWLASNGRTSRPIKIFAATLQLEKELLDPYRLVQYMTPHRVDWSVRGAPVEYLSVACAAGACPGPVCMRHCQERRLQPDADALRVPGRGAHHLAGARGLQCHVAFHAGQSPNTTLHGACDEGDAQLSACSHLKLCCDFPQPCRQCLLLSAGLRLIGAYVAG